MPVGATRPRSVGKSRLIAWDMGEPPPPALLDEPWDAIVHAAADTRWTLSEAAAYEANVVTAQALVPLVSGRTHVIHISTAFATGLRGSTASTQLKDYRNTYEWSKAYAERVAQAIFPRLTIIRPPLIMGRRADGHAARFSGMYTLLRGLTAGLVPALVANPNGHFEVIPVDDLVTLIVSTVLADASSPDILTIGRGEHALRVQGAVELLIDSLNRWRTERGLEPLARPPIVSPESWQRFFFPFVTEQLSARQLRVIELLSNFQPYLAIDEALAPTHPIGEIEACIATSVRYWADAHERHASQPLRLWEMAA